MSMTPGAKLPLGSDGTKAFIVTDKVLGFKVHAQRDGLLFYRRATAKGYFAWQEITATRQVSLFNGDQLRFDGTVFNCVLPPPSSGPWAAAANTTAVAATEPSPNGSATAAAQLPTL